MYLLIFMAAYYATTFFAPKLCFLKWKSLYNSGKYEQSYKYIKKALTFAPNNTDYRYYIVQTLSELKPTYKVQKEVYKYAHSNIDDGAKILANEKINEWQKNIHSNIGNNYIEQAPSDTNIIRWNKESFPLKIYIDTESLSNLPDYYKSAVVRAVNQWEKSVDFISFKTTDKKSEAQILILFEKLPENICEGSVCKYVVGYTHPKISGKKLKNMTITLYDKNPKDEYFSDKEVYNTVLHELGHALGIMGHSYSTDDLMYQEAQNTNNIFIKYREDFHYLSGNDVNTMKLLYMLEPTITDKPSATKKGLIYTPIILGSPQEMASKKVEEAKDYIKTSPGIAVGYINLAGAYADLKEYDKALSALQSALDLANTDQEKFVIYYNYAYVYLNMGKYDSALNYAKLADQIMQTEDVRELISIIEHNRSIKK